MHPLVIGGGTRTHSPVDWGSWPGYGWSPFCNSDRMGTGGHEEEQA